MKTTVTITTTRDTSKTGAETRIDVKTTEPVIQAHTHAGTTTLDTYRFIEWLNRELQNSKRRN